jgi:uncharacterized MAPEG superfamily protein
MTIAYFCIIIAIFIPLLCAGYAKFSRKGYNNSSPREYLEKLDGKARRANYAQMNSFEAFAPFATGVIVAHQLHAPQDLLNTLALSFITARILYVIFYIIDRPSARSLVWCLGLMITISLFFIGR